MASAKTSTTIIPFLFHLLIFLKPISTGNPPAYQSQSLACKNYDMIHMDCSKRKLADIPLIPNHHNTTITLDLSFNNLTEINGAPFVKLSILQELHLNNNKITKISEQAFSGLRTLAQLDLSYNNITALPENIFNDLSHLLYLFVSNNYGASQSHIPSQAFQPLNSLQILTLNTYSLEVMHNFPNLTHLNIFHLSLDNLQSNITNASFNPLSGLRIETFSMLWGQVSEDFTIESNVFSPLTTLKWIAIQYDAFQKIGSLYSPVEKLKIYPSYSKFIRELVSTTLQVLARWNSSLLELKVSLSTIESIVDYTFIWVPQLRVLDLSDNVIVDLALYAFYGLHKLNVLILQNNRLASIPSLALDVFKTSRSLRWFDLSFNSISGKVAPDAFSAVPNLIHLNLGRNQIDLRRNWWVNTFHNLTQLILDENQATSLGAYLKIEPPLKSLQILQLSRVNEIVFIIPMCIMFPNLQHAILSYAPIDNFPYKLALDKCPHLVELDLSGSISNIQSLDINQAAIILPQLRRLYLARNKVTSIEQIQFIKALILDTLELYSNDIKLIDNAIFTSYPNLVSLDLRGNAITSIDGLEHLTELRNLYLSKNQLSIVPPWLLFKSDNLALEKLDLSHNPFLCTCDIQPFKTWILSDTITRLVPNQYTCASPDAMEGLSVTSIELDCRSHIGFYLSISIPLLLALCICIIFLYRYRWNIKYRLFLLYRNQKRFPEVDEDFEMVQMDGHPQYHAYVSYDEDCQHDEDWVFNDLRPNMEEGPEPLRLCIKGRDFIPGHSIIQTISESILQSCKTILVMTPHFVESEWCYYEMQMAQMRLFHENRNVLILVLLDEIPDNKLTMSLRQLLCKKAYLKWTENRVGQRLFWQRLREALKTPVRIDRRYDV